MNDFLDNPRNVLYIGQGFSLEQSDDFARWLRKLRDRDGRLRILKRLRRLSDGQFGDCQPVGEGVHELRMFFGPGYRVYFIQRGDGHRAPRWWPQGQSAGRHCPRKGFGEGVECWE